ncbi:MAG: hypothetical protein COA97_09795 [Flavobacteriales bacterium]|nr:MAG: hypothetical protein COA97_09795 [Flavobacteriales bacterium]
MTFYKFHILIFLVFASLVGVSQLDGDKQEDKWMEDNIFLDGVVTNYYTGKSISGVTIIASVKGAPTAKGTTDGKGEYKTVLEYDRTYTITFSKAGYISKTITMNTSGVPDLKRQKVPDMGAEITLFKPNDCIDAEILKTPIGRAVYYPKKNIMDWDMDYSMPRLEKLNKMLDKCAKEAEKVKKEEEQKERDYNSAMKEADKAFTEEEWINAVESYKKAIVLFNDRPGPKNKLKLIETELAKKAEAEKQRVEEKARAEAEENAKIEAEIATKLAEEERIAKEKAEAEVLAKTEAVAKEKAKAVAAAKLAEQERIAKEKKEAQALAKKEAEQKAKLEKEALTKKIAEEKARKEETEALKQMAAEEKAKATAQKEAQQRADAEEKALANIIAAKKREAKERKAKELAAKLAKKAEEERAVNQVFLQEKKEEVIIKVAQHEDLEQKSVIEAKEKPKQGKISGSSTIKFKSRNKSRHLYIKPNKHKKGKGPQPKKRIVF